ncbi:type IV pilin protein [Planctomycetota bacterium]
MKAKSGFTLVEILIVVVILGILAAIVIPQFTDASTEAKEARLASDLQMMRSQIELYKIQHTDALPDTNSYAEFVTAMTVVDSDGRGPYMQKIPSNPFAPAAVADTVTFAATADGDNSAGWNLDPTTERFQAHDSGTCPDGSTKHSDL